MRAGSAAGAIAERRWPVRRAAEVEGPVHATQALKHVEERDHSGSPRTRLGEKAQ